MRIYFNFLRSFLMLFLGCLYLQTIAQDTLSTDDVYVIKDFNPVLATEGAKIAHMPSIIQGKPKKLDVQYGFTKKEYKVFFEPQPITPAYMKREALDKIYKGYVKGGVGSYLTSYFDAHYSTTRSSQKSAGINLFHNASMGTIRNKGYSGFSKNRVSAFGKKIMNKHILEGNVFTHFDKIHYYGYDPVFFPEFDKKNTQNYYFNPGFEISFSDKNILEPQKKSFQTKLTYQYLQDKFKSQEHNPVYTLLYNMPLEKHRLQIDAKVDYNQFIYTDSAQQSISSTIAMLTPAFISKFDFISVKLGAALFLNTASDSSKLSFKPIIDVQIPLFEGIIVPYIGIKGSVERNNFQSLRLTNPFIHSTYLRLQNSDIRQHIYAGVKCSFSSTFQFNLYANSLNTRGLPLFVNDTFGIVNHYFLVQYDRVQTNSLHAEFNISLKNKMNILLTGEYFSYQTSVESTAWHLPSTKISTQFKYNLYQKIYAGLDLFYVSSRFAKLYGFQNGVVLKDQMRIVELKPFADVNISLEYRYTHKIGAFMQVNNLLAQRYELWYNYPVQVVNIVGGVKILF